MRTSTDRLTRRQWLKKGALLVPAGFVFPRILTRAATVTVIQPTRYTAYAATFDGTNDYLTRAALTGAADGKTWAFSCWVKFNGGDGSQQTIFSSSNISEDKLLFYKTSGNKLAVVARNSSGTNLLDAYGSTSITVSSGWTHFYCSFDLANAGNRLLYVNGATDTPTWSTYLNGNVDITGTYTRAGANYTASAKLAGCLCEVWLDDSYLNSTYVASFRNASTGEPEDLGSDGSTPTGSQPLLYLHNPYSSFQTNSGSGGDFSVVGALEQCTPP